MNPSVISKSPIQASQISSIPPLDDHSVIAQLHSVLHLVKTCYGPRSQLVMLQNNLGGQLTLTSCISRIVRQLNTNNPIIKFILTSVEGHINTFSDGGLLVAFLCIKLIRTSLALNINRAVLSDIYSVILRYCSEYLESASCPSKRELNLTNMSDLYSLVKGVMSCAANHLDNSELEHVCRLTVKAFLNTMPINGDLSQMPSIQYVSIEGQSPSHCDVIEGLLYQVPYLTLKRSMLRTLKTLTMSSQPVKIVLFGISLSGDSEGFMNMRHEVRAGAYSEQHSLGKSELFDADKLLHMLEASDVKLLVCQKVVHPSLYKACLGRGILVLDRLGQQLANALQQISGCQPIRLSNVFNLDNNNMGILHAVEMIELGDKTYLRLHNRDTVTNTFVLCHRYEEPLQEMRLSVESAHHVLIQTLQTPYVLSGRGQWLRDVADHMTRLIQHSYTDILQQSDCTRSVLNTACANFVKCLRYVAMSSHDASDDITMAEIDTAELGVLLNNVKQDTTVGDNTPLLLTESGNDTQPPTETDNNSETFTEADTVLDSFITKTKALQCAVKTAAILLKVNIVITDPN